MRLREGGLWFGLGWAFEVAGVLDVGVVTPLVRPGSLVVPDGERGDPGDLTELRAA
jgi:hypothetical protein